MADNSGSESLERPAAPRGDAQDAGIRAEVELPGPATYPTTNGTAIMALVATLVPFPLVGGILGVVLGIFGVREIHRYGQTGGAIAVAAITLGSFQLAFVLISPILFASAISRLLGTDL